VVALPLEHLHGVALVVFAPVVGRADARDVDDGEALVADALLDERDRLGHVVGAAARGVGRARAEGEARNVERAVDVAVGRGGAELVARRRGRVLPARHAVDAVVKHDDREADVAPRRVDEVVAADGGHVAVAREDDDLELRPRELDARGKRDGAAVRRVDGVEVEIARRARRAADARDDDRLVAVESKVLDGLRHVAQDDSVAAAGAPDGGQMLRAHVFVDEVRGVDRLAADVSGVHDRVHA